MLSVHYCELLSVFGKEYGEDIPHLPGTLVTHIYSGKAYKCAKAFGVVVACDPYDQKTRDKRKMLVLWTVKPPISAG